MIKYVFINLHVIKDEIKQKQMTLTDVWLFLTKVRPLVVEMR